MQSQLLPTEEIELAKATSELVEAERALREDHRKGIKWGFLPAIAMAVAVGSILNDLGASLVAQIVMGVVSGMAAGSWIEVLFLRKRVLALEALVRLRELRTRITDGALARNPVVNQR